MYKVFRNSEGRVDAVNRIQDGATIPTWDETHPLTIEFQEWLAGHPEFDMSDRPPEPRFNNIAEARTAINLSIDALRVEKESTFIWTRPGTSETYPVQSDLNSRINISGAVQAAQMGLWQVGSTWRMENNVEVVVSSSDLLSMATALFVHVDRCYRAAFAHKRAIAALETVEAITAYDITQDWD